MKKISCKLIALAIIIFFIGASMTPAIAISIFNNNKISSNINDNAFDSIEKSIYVGSQPPIANFTYVPTNPQPEETVYFTDTSIDPDGTIIAWWWDFGDDYYSVQQNPTHEYGEEGAYIVNLTVTDNDSDSDSVEKTIIVFIPNSPPYEPSNPYPANGSIDVELNVILNWTGGDPDGDPVTYDVYFGNVTPPPLVSSNQTNTTFNPGTLNLDTDYYWQIVAWDNQSASTPGPIWTFTSEGFPNNKPYAPIITGDQYVTVGAEHPFTFQSDDPDDDDIKYIITWGDSSEDESDFVPADTPVTINHTFLVILPIMILRITAWAEDEHGVLSNPAEKWVLVIGFSNQNTAPNVVSSTQSTVINTQQQYTSTSSQNPSQQNQST